MTEEELLRKIAELEQGMDTTYRVLKASKNGAALLDPNCPKDREWFEENTKIDREGDNMMYEVKENRMIIPDGETEFYMN